MRESTRADSEFIRAGVERLYQEAFALDGPGHGAEEIMSTSVTRQAMSQRYERVLRGGVWGIRDFEKNFSDEAMDLWLLDVRERLYELGVGTWVTYRVHLYPDAEGWLEVFDEEIFLLNERGQTRRGFHPASAAEVHSELVAFPRRLENIPEWMLERLRAEDVPPPFYNEELQAVEYRNRRLPVTPTGTDFSVEEEIIDPSLEPGVFARIGKKLFGN